MSPLPGGYEREAGSNNIRILFTKSYITISLTLCATDTNCKSFANKLKSLQLASSRPVSPRLARYRELVMFFCGKSLLAYRVFGA